VRQSARWARRKISSPRHRVDKTMLSASTIAAGQNSGHGRMGTAHHRHGRNGLACGRLHLARSGAERCIARVRRVRPGQPGQSTPGQTADMGRAH
jgi:hypothetical protein